MKTVASLAPSTTIVSEKSTYDAKCPCRAAVILEFRNARRSDKLELGI